MSEHKGNRSVSCFVSHLSCQWIRGRRKRLYCTFDCFLGKRIMMFVFDCVLGSNQKNDTTTQASLIPNRNSKRLGAEPEQCKANWLCITQRGRGAPRGREQKARGSVKISAAGCTKHHDRLRSASRGCISHNFTCSSSGLIRRASGSASKPRSLWA